VNLVDVSVVIRTKNEADCIGETLDRVGEQKFDGDYEVVVVDSGSTDSTLNIIKEYDVKLVQIPQREFTFGRALNLGAIHARGKFLVNLSAHAFPRDKTWLANLIREFEDDNVAGVYGRQLSFGHLNPFDKLRNTLFFGPEDTKFSMKNRGMLKQIHFSNSNSAIRKNVWHGFKFNERVPYAEDILWQTAVIEAGFSIAYAAGAAVCHTHKVSIYGAYKNSSACAYALASMARKRRSVPLIMCDVGIFLCLLPKPLFHNLWYVWRNKYHRYLKLVPSYVLSEQLGWLLGRIRYRLENR
jgi:rhamnosyltransferase